MRVTCSEWDIHVRSRAFWSCCWAAHSTSLNNARFGSHDTQLHCRHCPTFMHISHVFEIFHLRGYCQPGMNNSRVLQLHTSVPNETGGFLGVMPRLNQLEFIDPGLRIHGSTSGLTSSRMLSSSTVTFSQQTHNPLERWICSYCAPTCSNIQTSPRLPVCLLRDRYSLARQVIPMTSHF